MGRRHERTVASAPPGSVRSIPGVERPIQEVPREVEYLLTVLEIRDVPFAFPRDQVRLETHSVCVVHGGLRQRVGHERVRRAVEQQRGSVARIF